MKKLIFLLILQFSLAISISTFLGCASTAKENRSSDKDDHDLVLIRNPAELIKNRKLFFKHEWKAINQRRGNSNSNDQLPPHTIGLALSGGGIRANAFQLGTLAGLYEAGLLSEIDYISTVSGGSWAAAAYLFTEDTDKKFFNELNLFKSIHLLKKQGKFYREGWRSEIVDGVLRNDGLLYKGLHLEPNVMKRLYKKPYFIINATHSNEPTEFAKECNFNIQFTRDAVMAPADCKSEIEGVQLCSQLQRLSWSLPTAGGFGKGFMVRNRKNSDYQFYVNTFPFPWLFTQELRISDILAASSAVVTKLYGNWFRIKKHGVVIGGGSDKNMRDKYRLSDGGKSENLGAIALMQRGVNLVIISQMAQDANIGFSDLELLNIQLKKKFRLQVDEDAIKKNIKCGCQLYSESKYGKIDEKDIITEKEADRNIIFIKPTYYNICGFKSWLQAKCKLDRKFQDILDALNEDIELTKKIGFDICHKTGFPQHPTFCPKYEEGIIPAYYLLGKYVIETTDIIDKIKEKASSR